MTALYSVQTMYIIACLSTVYYFIQSSDDYTLCRILKFSHDKNNAFYNLELNSY